MQTLPELKRGDTFYFTASLTDGDNMPIIGAVDQLRAQIRDNNDILIDTVVITAGTNDGDYDCKVDDTTEWVIDASLFLDIEYNDGTYIISSETLAIPVRKDITQ